MEVAVEETAFETWEECLSVSNGAIELVVTVGVGPRVIACRAAGGENLFHTDEEQSTFPGHEPFRRYGGHRLWHAPENEDRTYAPDNDPVEWTETDRGVRVVQDTEPTTGIRKSMSLELAADAPVVEVTHELTNEGVWPIECAPWAISVMRGGGTAVLPFSRGDPEGLLPDRSLSVWPYATLADDRLAFAEGAVRVTQDDDCDGPLKVGASGADEWAAYVTNGVAFVTEFVYDGAATYPDRGAAIEAYTDDEILELETLGPLEELAPGESTVHTETWRLVEGVEAPTARAVVDAAE